MPWPLSGRYGWVWECFRLSSGWRDDGGSVAPEHQTSVAGLSRREAAVLLTGIAALWVALFCNNTRLLPLNVGFDARPHADYINYLQEHKALPLPNEGLEMFQPPLYYVISAAHPFDVGSFGERCSSRHGPAPAHDEFWSGAYRIGFSESAPALPRTIWPAIGGTGAGRLFADAPLSVALCDQRDAGRNPCLCGHFPLFAFAAGGAHVPNRIRGAWIVPGRGPADQVNGCSAGSVHRCRAGGRLLAAKNDSGHLVADFGCDARGYVLLFAVGIISGSGPALARCA